MNMKLAFSSLACPSSTVDDVISKGKAYGFQGIELRTLENTTDLLSLDDFSCERIQESYEKFKMSQLFIPVIGTSVSFARTSPEDRNQQLKQVKDLSILAEGLHCPYLRVFAGPIPEGQTYAQVLARDIEGYKKAVKIADAYGIKLLLETHDDFSMSSAMLPLLEALDGKIGVIWDILHPHRWGEAMETSCKSLAPYLCHVHIKDSLHYSRDGFDIALPGEGSVPVAEAISLLKDTGYDGFLSFEWEKHWHPEIPDADISLPCYIDYMKKIV